MFNMKEFIEDLEHKESYLDLRDEYDLEREEKEMFFNLDKEEEEEEEF